MKRAVVHSVILLVCFASLTDTLQADINSSWKSLGQTKIHKNIKTTIPFRPDSSVAENNLRLKEHRANSIVVSATVPTSQLDNLRLVNHSAKWQVDDQAFLGRVTAVSLSGDQKTATIFAEIEDFRLKQLDLEVGQGKLKHVGLLSVDG